MRFQRWNSNYFRKFDFSYPIDDSNQSANGILVFKKLENNVKLLTDVERRTTHDGEQRPVTQVT